MTPPILEAQPPIRVCCREHSETRETSLGHLARAAVPIREQLRITTSSTPATPRLKMPAHELDTIGSVSCPPMVLIRTQDGILHYFLLPFAHALPASLSRCALRSASFVSSGAENGGHRPAHPKIAIRPSQVDQEGCSPSPRNPFHYDAGLRAHDGVSSPADLQPALGKPEETGTERSPTNTHAEYCKQAPRSAMPRRENRSLQSHREASPLPLMSQTGSIKGKSSPSRRRRLCKAALAWLGIRMATQESSTTQSAPNQELAGVGGSSTGRKRCVSRNLDGGDGKKSSKKHKAKKVKPNPDEQNSKRLWACPFLRKDACVHQRCGTFVMQKISHVIQHLVRKHFMEGDRICAMCGREMDTQQEYDEHIRARSCPQQVLGYMTRRQQTAILEVANRRGRGFSDEEKWYSCWDILFPNTPRPMAPRGPYLEHALLEEFSRVWELGNVGRDPRVMAAYPGTDGEVGLQQFLLEIRDAAIRQITNHVHAQSGLMPPLVRPLAHEHAPILQPHLSARVASAARRIRPAQALPSLITPQPQNSLSFHTRAQPENMAAFVQQDEASAGQVLSSEFGQYGEAPHPIEPGQMMLNMAYDTSDLWMDHNTMPDDDFTMSVSTQDLDGVATGSSPMPNWNEYFSSNRLQPESLQPGHNTLSMHADAGDGDEYLELDNAGENNFMTGGSRRWSGHDRGSL